MNANPESPCPELSCAPVAVVNQSSNEPLPYTNDAVSSGDLCPPGVTPISSAALPGWITWDGSTFEGAAGIYRGTDKDAANAVAQKALDSFVQAAFLNGTLVCDCPTILTAIMPANQWLPAPGVEIANFYDGYGFGPNGAGKDWKRGSSIPTSLVQAAWLAVAAAGSTRTNPILTYGGASDPWWDGAFPTYGTSPSSIANPIGGAYIWRADLCYPVFCRLGRVMRFAVTPAAYVAETEQAYAVPSVGGQPPGMFQFTVRCVNGILVWLLEINSEFGGNPGGQAGCWYKLGGYTPEGTYKLVTGSSPPHTVYADFPEFGAGSTNMPAKGTWHVEPYLFGISITVLEQDQAPVIGIFAQVNMVLLPNQEYSDSSHAKVLEPGPPIQDPFAYKFNFIRYLNADVHGLNGTFYMTRDGSNNVYASTDGYTWSVVSTIANAAGLTDIAYGNGKFVVTSKHRLTGQATIYSSSNAIAWTEVDLPLTENNGDLNSVVFGSASGGVFLVCQTNQNGSGTSFYSSNGTTWLPVTTLSPSTQPRFANNLFLIVSKFGEVASSSDCATWTAHTSIPQNLTAYDIAFGGFQYVVVGVGFIYTSPDLKTWHSHSFPSLENFVSIAFGVFVFVVVTGLGNVYRSSDGINWTQIMCYGQMKWTGEDNNGSFEQVNQLGGFVVPAANATVTVQVYDSNRMSLVPGRSVVISDGVHVGTFTVVSRSFTNPYGTVLLRFLHALGDSAPGVTMGQYATVSPLGGGSVFVRGSGSFFGRVFVGTTHLSVGGSHSFPGGTLLSVTYYSDTKLFIGAASLSIGTPSQGILGVPNGQLVYFYSTNGVNWGYFSPAAPQGPLKSVCFQQGGTFIAV